MGPEDRNTREQTGGVAFRPILSTLSQPLYENHTLPIRIGYTAPRTVFFREGDRSYRVYEVLEGAVKLYNHLADGRRLITGFFLPGDVLGLIGGKTCMGTAEAITRTKYLWSERAGLEALIASDPSVARQMLDEADRELRNLQVHLTLLGQRKPAGRVAAFLIALIEKLGAPADENVSVPMPMSQADIADYLALTPETISRVFSRLRNQRVITAGREETIIVRDVERLFDLADGDSF